MRALDEWVARDVAPPPSRYPRLADGTLAAPERAGWPALRELPISLVRNEPVRMDYGAEWSRGIVTIEPPRLGHVYPALVPAVDADGNDRAGVRMPEIAVPLATQTGWNPRAPRTGAADALAGVVGSYLPFARTRAAREASRRSAPRRSRSAIPTALRTSVGSPRPRSRSGASGCCSTRTCRS